MVDPNHQSVASLFLVNNPLVWMLCVEIEAHVILEHRISVLAKFADSRVMASTGYCKLLSMSVPQRELGMGSIVNVESYLHAAAML